jgi:K(+)-stimulated pyrophosphate-energized sodium pump
MSAFAHVASQEVALTGSNYTTVVIVALIALAALGVAAVLVRQVLAADEGTVNMRNIAKAIQEGASAYLNRQFRTLAIFAVLVFFLLFLLPAETQNERIGRSLFFLVGAVFSGITG